jgi:PAS domain S-box-containing protein
MIEDNLADARLVQELFKEANDVSFSLESVDTLAVGLRRLSESKPDIVLLDLGLPDSQGIDTFLRLYQETPQVPIVVLTGLADSSVGIEAVRSGAQDYIVKNELESRLLTRCVRYAIERHRLQDDLRDRNRALQASEARFRAIVDLHLDAILVVSAGGKILLGNPAAETLFGIRITELREHNLGFPITQKGFSELVITRSTGEDISVEAHITALGWEEQRAYLVCLHDVSERQRAESAILHSERRFQSLVESIPGAVYIASLDRFSRIYFISERVEPILGFTARELQSQPHIWANQIHPEDREEALAMIARSEKSGPAISIDYRMLNSSGDVVWISDQSVIVKDDTETARHVQGVIFDVTRYHSN